METMLKSRMPAATAVTILALAAAACTSTGTASTTGQGKLPAGGPAVVPGHSSVHWHGCGGQLSGLKCGSVRVPLDYSHPNGRSITLALSMAPATAPPSQQQGVLLVNPGGPGGSGLSLAAEVAQGLSPSVAADYDIVGFDPRGVGSSTPRLSCDPSFFSRVRPDYIPASKAQEQVLIGRAKMYAQGCQKRFGWMLPYMTTANVARDMNSIRAAFGVSQVNYYAFSYGTYLGQVFATLFPHQVRRMVLDSVVDPTGVWWADNIEQDYAFQGRMNAFFAWAARYDSTYHLGSTRAAVRNSWYQARAKVKAHPAAGRIGPDEFDDTFLIGGYLDNIWPGLAQALSAYLHSGSATAMVSEFQANGTQNENEFAVYNAVQCADVGWPRDWAKWDRSSRAVYRSAPFEAWDNAWFNAACAFWPVHAQAKPMQIRGAGLPPILMLQGTLDPATPYAGAQNAHKLLPSARMVVVSGGGNHGQSMEFPANGCVQNYLNGYLATGAVPHGSGLVNATCARVPDPAPGG